ncbi:hypothetical protein PVAP13_1NG020944 [Panicum virgatum]|uniref:Uncharacterized protein n=1 Tax=Panicum virgatum TaxID=38727 RepID=A0A8T0WI79_PANVG|nr:hypothetical protein PVAP13_1NG020944 [Panicum virgatum]
MLRAASRRSYTPSRCASAGTRGPMLPSSGGPHASQVDSAVAPRTLPPRLLLPQPTSPPPAAPLPRSCRGRACIRCVLGLRDAMLVLARAAWNVALPSRKRSSALKLLDEMQRRGRHFGSMAWT